MKKGRIVFEGFCPARQAWLNLLVRDPPIEGCGDWYREKGIVDWTSMPPLYTGALAKDWSHLRVEPCLVLLLPWGKAGPFAGIEKGSPRKYPAACGSGPQGREAERCTGAYTVNFLGKLSVITRMSFSRSEWLYELLGRREGDAISEAPERPWTYATRLETRTWNFCLGPN